MQTSNLTPNVLGAVVAVSVLAAVILDSRDTFIKNRAPLDGGTSEKVADGPETQKIKAMVADIAFITEYSNLEYAGQVLPDIRIVTAKDLQLRYEMTEALATGRRAARVSAIYDRKANKVYLSAMNEIRGPGLLHELVHYLQDINGKDDMFADHMVCLEAEAYDVQALWQTLKKIDEVAKPDYGFVMTLYGACNDADFSWVKSNPSRLH